MLDGLMWQMMQHEFADSELAANVTVRVVHLYHTITVDVQDLNGHIGGQL